MSEKDEESRKRRRAREDEKEEEEKKKALSSSGPLNKESIQSIADELEQYIQKAGFLIEQLNNLYQMFMLGVEKFPPVERRKQLEQMMLALQSASKTSPSLIFKFNGVQSRYVTYRDRWDRLLKDLDSGKIKRVTGPNKNS